MFSNNKTEPNKSNIAHIFTPVNIGPILKELSKQAKSPLSANFLYYFNV